MSFPGSGPPQRRLRYMLLLLALGAVVGSAGDPLVALVTFAIFGATTAVFYVVWAIWERRGRPLPFDLLWLAALVVIGGLFVVVIAARSGVERAMIDTAPAVVLVALWIVLRRILGTRAK